MTDSISHYFKGVGAKRLSHVEVSRSASKQHEFNGISAFREILGTERHTFQGHFIYVTDDEGEILEDSDELTWYDARESHRARTEYRLYYKTNSVIEKARAEDLVVIARRSKTELFVIVAQKNTTSEHQLLWLFGLAEISSKFVIRDFTEEDLSLNYSGKYIIKSLGINVQDSAPEYLDELKRSYGDSFPNTDIFSAYARSTLPEVNPVEDPDNTLMVWLEREEILFKTFEEYLVAKKLNEGFGSTGKDVEEFISFSLSVQNRRKSRAGLAFENHLEAIFNSHRLKFSRGARTERNNRPDFLFPEIDFYHNDDFNPSLLTMLGVKTSIKERWRQVLNEADRIKKKHLITLEPAISKNQTDEMFAQSLQLVIPLPILDTYEEGQRAGLISLNEFIEKVKENQHTIYD